MVIIEKIKSLIKSSWKWILASILVATAAVTSVLRISSAKESTEKKLHDQRVKGQKDVVEAESEKNKKIDDAQKDAAEKKEALAEETEQKKRFLTSKEIEELTALLTKKYGINSKDVKP